MSAFHNIKSILACVNQLSHLVLFKARHNVPRSVYQRPIGPIEKPPTSVFSSQSSRAQSCYGRTTQLRFEHRPCSRARLAAVPRTCSQRRCDRTSQLRPNRRAWSMFDVCPTCGPLMASNTRATQEPLILGRLRSRFLPNSKPLIGSNDATGSTNQLVAACLVGRLLAARAWPCDERPTGQSSSNAPRDSWPELPHLWTWSMSSQLAHL